MEEDFEAEGMRYLKTWGAKVRAHTLLVFLGWFMVGVWCVASAGFLVWAFVR